MIEIVTHKYKATDIDQEFMDRCAELQDNWPASWHKYKMDLDGINDIINMEYAEMVADAKSKNYEDYKTNIIHLSTALLYAWRIAHNVRIE